MVPGGALGDGNSSIIGTTVLQPQQHSQRKGILKRTATQDCGAQNNWDYQLSPEQKRKEHHDDHSRENPDILQLPMGLPPPPPSGSSAGTTLTNAISGIQIFIGKQSRCRDKILGQNLTLEYLR